MLLVDNSMAHEVVTGTLETMAWKAPGKVPIASGEKRLRHLPVREGGYFVSFRVDTIDPSEAARHLENAGYRILWPSKP